MKWCIIALCISCFWQLVLNEKELKLVLKKNEIRRLKMAENSNVIELTDGDFESTTGEGVSLVDFWAPWCQPCRIQGPILEKVANHLGEKAKICKINVDEHREHAMKYGISGIPSLLLFKDGEKVQQFVGVQQDSTLVSSIESNL